MSRRTHGLFMSPTVLRPSLANSYKLHGTHSRNVSFAGLHLRHNGSRFALAPHQRSRSFQTRTQGPHFWDEAAYPVRVSKPGRYDGSFPAYVGVFDKAAARIKANENAITGEASSNTFTAVYSHLR